MNDLPSIDLVVPEFAEEDDEKLQVVKWLFHEGDAVEEGDELVELLTDKATFTLPAPEKGTLEKILITEGQEIVVGEVIGRLKKVSADQRS